MTTTLQNPEKVSRRFGINFIGSIPWGTHLCQFYETKQDLIDILVPYFTEGLRSNEFCMWITSPPLEVAEATAALRKAVPDLDRYFESGQLEIISYKNWYLLDGQFSSNRVLQGWVNKETYALEKGFEGLRLSGNTFWIQRELWRSFIDYEAAVNAVIGKYRMIALCTYCLSVCSGTDVIDVVSNHIGTLIKQGNRWVLVEDAMQRQRAQEALKEGEMQKSSSLYARSLIEASPDPLVTISAEGKITDVNKATERVTGCTRDKLIGSDFSDYFTEPQKARAGYMKVFSEGTVRDYPLAIQHVSGKITYVLYNASLYRNEEGEVQGVFAAARDITLRKEAEDQLRRASLYARSLLEASLDPLVTIDADGKITDVNRATEDVTECTRQELIGSDFSDYFTEPEKARAGYKQVFKLGFVRDYPLAIRGKTGKVTEVLYNATVYRNEAGQIQGVFAAARDITERKIAEEKLLSASQYARSLLEASLDPLVTISADGKITDVNQATEDVTGYSREQLIGSDFSDYFTEPEKARAGYKQVFTDGFVKDYQLAIRHRNGKVTDVLYNASVYQNAEGEVQGVFAAARDITQRIAMENELRQTMDKLKQSNAELEQFAYVASHDLQEPLRMVASYVQLLERRYKGRLDGDADEFIGYAVDGANRMRALIDDLLTYSRVGRLGKPFEPVDLNKTMAVVLQNLSATIDDSNAQVTYDKLPVVKADGGQLAQLFQNLIGNAIKFHGKEKPKVHISVKEQDSQYLFAVKDNGIGINPEYYERLFKIFQRLHTREEYPGSGIGLAICKKIVERHGGRIWVESQSGIGSTFYFTLNKKEGQK